MKTFFRFLLFIFSMVCWLPLLASNKTLTYNEMVKAYQELDKRCSWMRLQIAGYSDQGNPMHLLVVNKRKQFEPTAVSATSSPVWLLMNGIHPGESEGIDASLEFLQYLALHPETFPDNLTLLVIPCYNVDGMINRKKYTRCGQNGPEEKGFRGNARHQDLNRDFLKADSRNTFVFYDIFRNWNPNVFLDTHTSNGADYQYTMTLISTQKQKLGGPAAAYLYGQMNPYLYSKMAEKGYEMAPYVNVFGKSPDDGGYSVFSESPMFSTGYAALYGCLGFVAETHMLKPYPERVTATRHLLFTFLNYFTHFGQELKEVRRKQQSYMQQQTEYASNFSVDQSVHKDLLFKGYELELIPSKLGNYQRHYYNRNRPYEKVIPYYDSCKAGISIPIPDTLLVPAQWHEVIRRLEANHVVCRRASGREDSLWVTVQYLSGNTDGKHLYEGHYVHQPFQTEGKRVKIKLRKGDVIIPLKQESRFYLMEVLSAQTRDGFMSWNFFDPVLNEKEGFSDYVFEDEAEAMLQADASLAKKFEEWKLANPDKAANKYEVLGWLYRHSPYAEQEYLRFPVVAY